MINDVNNLNSELYSNELFEDWISRKGIIPEEEFLIKTHLVDKTKCVVEAGTGGGRISFYIEQLGFNNIFAFDFVPEMIDYANKIAKNISSKIKFDYADATNLSNYDNNSFDYLVYLQQVLCFISNKELFIMSLNESYRIAKKDSIVIYSFLDFDSRVYNSLLSNIISLIRKIRGEKISKQYLPWLKINNKFNWKIFNKNQPINYWVKKDEIVSYLKKAGFIILEVKNSNEIIKNKKDKGMLYIVCKK